MRKRLWAGGLLFIAGAVLCPGQTATQKPIQTGGQNPVQDQPVLSPEDKVEIKELLRLKAAAGDKVWLGLAAADIPIVLFNARYEFLIGLAKPSSPWEAVPGEDIQGQPYFRREAHDPQAFAVKVGSVRAGSIGTLGYMNSKIPFRLSPDFHIVATLHEMFHAFQAERAPERFAAALAVYGSESRYPFKDEAFASAWTEEGAALAGALKAADEAEAARLSRKFLETREARRGRAKLDPAQLAFERELEWLEGLAEYAEIRFYELAASRPNPGSTIPFTVQLPFLLLADFARLENALGAQEGDLRFYLSGMAQARLLDRLSPGWKTNAAMGKAYLDDLLSEALSAPAKKREK